MSKFIVIKQVRVVSVPNDFEWDKSTTVEELQALGYDPDTKPIEDILNTTYGCQQYKLEQRRMWLTHSSVDSMQLYDEVTKDEMLQIVNERAVF